MLFVKEWPLSHCITQRLRKMIHTLYMLLPAYFIHHVFLHMLNALHALKIPCFFYVVQILHNLHRLNFIYSCPVFLSTLNGILSTGHIFKMPDIVHTLHVSYALRKWLPSNLLTLQIPQVECI